MAQAKPKHDVAPILRPFTTNYGGAWAGHCTTYNNAVEAIVKRLVRHGVVSATIEDPLKSRKEAVLARIRKTKEGFTVWAPHMTAPQPLIVANGRKPAPRSAAKRGPQLKRVK